MSHLHTGNETPVRASDAERERAAELLRAGYADGRLARAELDERLAAGYAAKTRTDLRSLTSDLPGTAATPAAGDGPLPADLPALRPEMGAGMRPDWCLLVCLLVAYSDIARLFGESPEALRSRRVLLTDAWELQPCASGRHAGEEARVREATPFFPPTTQRIDDEDDVDPDADLALPRSLSSRIFYVHSELTWYVNRQTGRPARWAGTRGHGQARAADARTPIS